MLLEQIKNDIDSARREKDSSKVTFLSTLYAEAAMVGKNKGNRPSTDDEVIAVVKKFVNNADETAKARVKRGESPEKEQTEITILEGYMPKQLSDGALSEAIAQIIGTLPDKSPKMMGKVMAELKAQHGGTYDGKKASEWVKNQLK